MNQLTQEWLSALCRLIQGVTRAVVFGHDPDNDALKPIACSPEGLDEFGELSMKALVALAKGQCIYQTTGEREPVTGEPLDIVACPFSLSGQPSTVVVMQMTRRVTAKQQAVVQQVKAAVCSFEAMAREHTATNTTQLVTIVELVASCLEHERFQAAATEVVTELASRFSCDRVSLGVRNGHAVTVAAVSCSARFDQRSNLIRDIGEAMHEAMDQNCTLVYPQPGDGFLLTRCHDVLAEEHGIGKVLTVPFVSNGDISGALLMERPADRPFKGATVAYLEQVVSMVGPVLVVRHRDEQWLPKRAGLALQRLFAKVFGPGQLALKFGLATLLLCLALLSFTSGEYRVTGAARLEARTQRVVVAPQDGFIAAAGVRPGDIVHSGDQLGALDDRDLKLEYRKWSAQLEQLRTEHRDALARHDRSKVGIISARIQQAEAQLNLVSEKLSRTRLAAPLDGLIVSGDLSQILGAPVERGQVLFTVAPLDAYRVILQVDERDIGSIRPGQPGNLVLSGMPRKPLPFKVEKITPVSVVEAGRTYFQVEAGMNGRTDLLRPGMEGIAKIEIDRRKLIWIGSHKLVDWLRLTLWSLRP